MEEQVQLLSVLNLLGLGVGEILQGTGVEQFVFALGAIEGECQFIVARVDVGVDVLVRVDVGLNAREQLTGGLDIVGDGVEATEGSDDDLDLLCCGILRLELVQEL